jgi:hypothetical protein
MVGENLPFLVEFALLHIPGDCDRHSDAIATAVPI